MIEKLHSKLVSALVDVGFSEMLDLPQNENVPQPPPGTRLWWSEYAVLALWPLSKTDTDTLRAAARAGETWLEVTARDNDESAEGRRRRDAYLVLSLPSAPSQEALEAVTDIELSTNLSRKHVIWEDRAGEINYTGLKGPYSITTVGLPEVSDAVFDLAGPDLSADEERWLNDLPENYIDCQRLGEAFIQGMDDDG